VGLGAVTGLEEQGIDRGMKCRDAKVVGIAPAGELGFEVEVDELGRDAMRELKSDLAGFLDDRLAPSYPCMISCIARFSDFAGMMIGTTMFLP
jgi:hypothetical protein